MAKIVKLATPSGSLQTNLFRRSCQRWSYFMMWASITRGCPLVSTTICTPGTHSHTYLLPKIGGWLQVVVVASVVECLTWYRRDIKTAGDELGLKITPGPKLGGRAEEHFSGVISCVSCSLNTCPILHHKYEIRFIELSSSCYRDPGVQIVPDAIGTQLWGKTYHRRFIDR